MIKGTVSANAGIRRGHAFGSGWVHWPLNSKPVFYWRRDLDEAWLRIYMAGNPVAWRLALDVPATCSAGTDQNRCAGINTAR